MQYDTSSPDQKKYENFVHMAAHELKTPVTVLKAYLQMIIRHLEKDKQASYIAMADKMDVQLNKLLNLISDLQDGVKANSEDIHCLMSDFNINESISSCRDGLQATNPDFKLVVELDETCPLIKGDHNRIEQVVLNLITNAIKYSDSEKYVMIRSIKEDGYVCVSVSDKGKGIPKEQQSKVFDQFYRVNGIQENQPAGLGLGLFICKEIIRKHDGKIGLESAPGLGSEFWFRLPCK